MTPIPIQIWRRLMHIWRRLIQIWRWLMHPKVWRLVGFAAAVVGLLCNALSSSFNHLFGEWNLLKTIFYTVISFILCVLILFAANIWQQPFLLRFKAHTTYLVLIITSLYSYFFDKSMKIKPDTYSLVSCASFAVMTLSLSRRQTQCGFEMDLLYFLLGCLMMQLMKIKFVLFVIGAVFSYFLLIILRSSFSSIDVRENNQYSELQDGNSVVLNMDSRQLARTNISSSSNSVDSPQLKALEKLETCVKALEHGNSKFIQMLLEHVKNYEHSQLVPADPNFMMAALKQETIKDLEETTNVMVRAAFENDFSDVYNNCSRKCLNECLMQRIFGLQKLNIEDVHNMSLKDLDDEIEKWIKANSNVALKMIFPCERRICDCIFKFSTSADFCLMDICRGSTIQLLKFSDYLATRSRSPEHLFKTLHMLKIMCDLILEFESLFCDQYNVSIKNEAIVVMAKKLGETIRGIFMELEYACNTADPTTSVLSIIIQ